MKCIGKRFILGIFLAGIASLHAQDLRLEFGVGRGGGDTAYEIRFDTAGVANRSKLSFPLDVALARGSASYTLPTAEEGELEIGLGAMWSLDDPQSPMIDEDWYGGFLVGYTESEIELSMAVLEVSGRFWQKRRPIRSGTYRWWWGGSLIYERYDAEVFGADGFYFPPLGEGTVFVDTSIRVLSYDLESYAALAGVGMSGACRRFCILASGETGPVYMEDFDIHRLRAFYADALAAGLALRLHGEGRLWLGEVGDSRWYLNLAVSYFSAYAWGNQTQYHINGTYSGIEDILTITRSSVTASLGCQF